MYVYGLLLGVTNGCVGYSLCSVILRFLLSVRSRGKDISLSIFNFLFRFGLVVGRDGVSSSSRVAEGDSPFLPCDPCVVLHVIWVRFLPSQCLSLYLERLMWWW